jgi:hypothetical protein
LEDEMDEAAIKALIKTAVEAHEAKPHGPHYSFKQITDNIRGLNSRSIKEVNDLIDAHESSGLKRGDTVELK